ncbi:acetyl-coenzyme A synthetase N-terminal domain-containing protein, partial [Burkholderia territorii]|uniref:acetyl-coenzyme A synthetase N-terminal domain-containing protein n=1 Tax=Burkholderia territorii TaxID=1503055 RepID=UPI002ED8F76F
MQHRLLHFDATYVPASACRFRSFIDLQCISIFASRTTARLHAVQTTNPRIWHASCVSTVMPHPTIFMETILTALVSILQEHRIFEPTADARERATISGMPAYRALAAEAEQDYEGFWARLAREGLTWHKPFTKVL